jgi:hypothetical protein
MLKERWVHGTILPARHLLNPSPRSSPRSCLAGRGGGMRISEAFGFWTHGSRKDRGRRTVNCHPYILTGRFKAFFHFLKNFVLHPLIHLLIISIFTDFAILVP